MEASTKSRPRSAKIAALAFAVALLAPLSAAGGRYQALTVTGVGFDESAAGAGAPVAPEWAQGELTAEGTAIAPERAADPAQARLLAKRGAIADAQRNLLEMVQGVQIDSTTRVRDFMSASDRIETRVRGVISAAKVAERENPDGSWTVTLKLELAPLAAAIREEKSGGDSPAARARALRAAKLDAERQLVELVYGVEFQTDASAGEFDFDYGSARARGVLRHAKVLAEYYNPETGAAEVKLFLHKRHVKRLAKCIKR